MFEIPDEYKEPLGIRGPVSTIVFSLKFLVNFTLELMTIIVPSIDLVVFLHRMRGVNIGKNVFIGNNVTIDRVFPHLIRIHDGAEIGEGTKIYCHSRGSKALRQYYPAKVMQTIIGKGAWVGVNCIILAGVEIGEYSVVGAGSVVTKNVAPFSVVVGNPARKIKDIPKESINPII
jgi:acetyltransferase-like isoleucine patch superfamily enzyme